MTASRLDRFPTGKRAKQIAQQRRLADFGCEPTHANDRGTMQCAC